MLKSDLGSSIQFKQLWKNSNPYASFGGQRVSLSESLAKYDAILIATLGYAESGRTINYNWFKYVQNSLNTVIIAESWDEDTRGIIKMRSFVMEGTTIWFTGGRKIVVNSSTEWDMKSAVPYAVYGVKLSIVGGLKKHNLFSIFSRLFKRKEKKIC